MKSTQTSIQYTIRNIPRTLDKSLRLRAVQRHKTLNETLLEALMKGAGLEGTEIYHDLDRFFGSWVEDLNIEAALKEQRKIDEAIWK